MDKLVLCTGIIKIMFLMLIGTPSADNPIPGINSGSSLLERLTASSNQNNQSTTPMSTPPSTNVNLQGVNLTSLSNSINGLQNVQVVESCLFLHMA